MPLVHIVPEYREGIHLEKHSVILEKADMMWFVWK